MKPQYPDQWIYRDRVANRQLQVKQVYVTPAQIVDLGVGCYFVEPCV